MSHSKSLIKYSTNAKSEPTHQVLIFIPILAPLWGWVLKSVRQEEWNRGAGSFDTFRNRTQSNLVWILLPTIFPFWPLAQHGTLHSGLCSYGFLGPTALGPQCGHWVEWHLTQKGHLALKGKFERFGKGGRGGRATSPSAVHWWDCCILFCSMSVWVGTNFLSLWLLWWKDPLGRSHGAKDWSAGMDTVCGTSSESQDVSAFTFLGHSIRGVQRPPPLPQSFPCVRWAHNNPEESTFLSVMHLG